MIILDILICVLCWINGVYCLLYIKVFVINIEVWLIISMCNN